jgi:hypothetical protein
MRHSSLICLILTLTAAELSAQTSHARGPVRIRLAPANSDWKPMIGVSVSIGADTILLVLDGSKDTVKVLTAGLARIERSTPGRSNVARGMLIGGLIGGAAGGATGYALGSSDTGDEGTVAPYMISGGIGVGALLGSIVGAIRSARSPHERWDAMPTIAAESPGPARGQRAPVRPGVAARIGF